MKNNKSDFGDEEKWTKCESKSRAGKFYMFNMSTGETRWCSSSSSTTKSIRVADEEAISSNLNVSKLIRTPAQDRLKRLQDRLKLQKGKKSEPAQNNNDCKKNRNEFAKEKKQTESQTFNNEANSKHTTQKKVRADKSQTTDLDGNNLKKGIIPRKRRSDECFKTPPKKTKMKCEDNEPRSTKAAAAAASAVKSSSGIVSKIKEIYKSTKQLIENVTIKKSSFKNPKKSVAITPNAVEEALKEILPQQQTQTKSLRQLGLRPDNRPQVLPSLAKNIQYSEANAKTGSPLNTPNSNSIELSTFILNTPPNTPQSASQRNSANTRLQRLRNSLQNQQENKTRLNESAKSSITSSATCNLPSTESIPNHDFEPMDWESIEDENTLSKAVETHNTLAGALSTTESEPTMADFYDRVNRNLLRLAAEKRHSSKNEWFKDFYYFVIDTNVMLRQLTFINDLSKMKLCDTKGTVLYIPYSVLQELDKLKMRNTASGEGVKTLAVRAIKYLNTNFEAGNIHIQAQSASAECSHLIDVDSADDSIINCCLQVKEKIGYSILLSEDINLRNKARSNKIIATTKSDLLSRSAKNGTSE